ncbi:uncharacterized protein isoform X2 [Leptinotarsa decemlineata]|uniref:uncharacterized protein isoform X2 n=1 Tax=Leptinotarsa decemlineata TaxID=7539 RepID=UPI000C254BC1|nr:uncharacterized protein LOC111505846 isoform X2 [Leptinotarsa decemlineata]
MVKIKKKEKYSNFKNINGHHLKLYIDYKPISLKVVVLNSTKALYKECTALGLFLGLDIVFLGLSAEPLNIIVVLCIFLLCYRICITAMEENLVIIKGLGIHIKTKYIVGSRTLFIPQEKVQNIFINEVILKETLPRLGMLTVVYSFTRKFIQEC